MPIRTERGMRMCVCVCARARARACVCVENRPLKTSLPTEETASCAARAGQSGYREINSSD